MLAPDTTDLSMAMYRQVSLRYPTLESANLAERYPTLGLEKVTLLLLISVLRIHHYFILNQTLRLIKLWP